MGYQHYDLTVKQSAKKQAPLCGDVVECARDFSATLAVICDGLGSGAKAHTAAAWHTARLMRMLAGGYSVRKAFGRILATLRANRGTDNPWAALALARVRPDGETTLLAHEMPGALLLSERRAVTLPARSAVREGCLMTESLCHLGPGDGVLLFSDGVSQAGMGVRGGTGWPEEEVAEAVDGWLRDGAKLREIPELVHDRARELWGKTPGDDCTVALLSCRQGVQVNILTGPPRDRATDAEIVSGFLHREGLKIICGYTTAAIAGRILGRPVKLDPSQDNPLVPPSYLLEGVDFVTEGAVTLSQVCRLLDADLAGWRESHGVSRLANYLQIADCVRMVVGLAENPANSDLTFRQLGVPSRRDLAGLIAAKLRAAGKLVEVEYA